MQYLFMYGHVDVLEWAYNIGCPWNMDEATSSAAASDGHLDIVKWLKSKHCPWNDATCRKAA
jgi:hypothetical protein